MVGSVIFKDRRRLSPRYVPKLLPHREQQLKFLMSLYEDSLRDVSEVYLQVCQIVGGVGTGKTCTAIRFGEILEERASERGIKLRHAYVNGKLETSSFTLYRSLLEAAVPGISTRSLSPEEMLHRLLEMLEERNQYILITVDEIGYFCKHSKKDHVIYDLTRLNEMALSQPGKVIGVNFVARDLSFYSDLDASERSTLGHIVLEFPRYSSDQIKDILGKRAEEAFKPGCVDDELLTFISELAFKPPINGDLRVGLDMLLYSGILAENQGYNQILPEHVRLVHSQTYPSITSEDIFLLDDAGKMVLWGVVRALQAEKTSYVGLREIREYYQMVCEAQNVKPVLEVEEHLQDLINRGIVQMRSLTEFGISDASAEELENFLMGIAEKVKHGLVDE
jgi:cell division control protein 6